MIKYIVASMLTFCVINAGLAQTENPIKVGDKAPDFVLENTLGERVALSKQLQKGTVILTWYRGSWCPYCNLALAELQEHIDEFKALGAQLIAISPQRADSTLTLQQKKDLQFILLSDTDSKVAQNYGIAFKLDEKTQQLYEEKITLSKYNGNTAGLLPIPATYIIDKNGIVRYAYVNKDYKQRANPQDILAALRNLTTN